MQNDQLSPSRRRVPREITGGSQLFQQKLTSPNELEEEPEDVTDDLAENEEQEAKADKQAVSITPETQYLGIRAILYDSQAAKDPKFKPVLVAAILGGMSKEPRGAKKKSGQKNPETQFQIRRYAVKMLVKHLSADVKAGQSILARDRGATLKARLGNVYVTPLAEITTEERVNEFVNEVVSMIKG